MGGVAEEEWRIEGQKGREDKCFRASAGSKLREIAVLPPINPSFGIDQFCLEPSASDS